MRNLPAIVVSAVLGLLLIGLVVTAAVQGATKPSNASTSDASAAPGQTAAPGPSSASAPSSAPGSSAPTATKPESVAFLGDGYTSGSPAGGQGQANYTSILSGRDGFRVTNDSVYGSGYVTPPALGTRVGQILAGGPQLVVVNAGRADDRSNSAAVGDAARRLYQDLRTRLPQAKIVVIGPMWLGGDVPPRMLAVRDAIRDAATVAQLPFVDPIADRWFNGSDQDGIAPGNVILNDKGHQRLAQLVEDALKRSGALPG